MALVNCIECGKQISSRAVSCPSCGCPLSAEQKQTSSPTPDSPPLEQRIEEYKKSGDSINKREGNSVTTHSKETVNKTMGIGVIALIVAFLLFMFFTPAMEGDIDGILLPLICVVIGVICIKEAQKNNNANDKGRKH